MGLLLMATTTAAQSILRSAMSIKSQIPEQYWELVDRYRDELVAQAMAILGNQEDAEDVVQETIIDAFRDTKKLAEVTSVGAWLKTLNRFNALDRQRAKRRSKDSKAIREREAKDKTFTTGGFSLVDLRESTQAALDTLPAELRDIVVLRYWEHLSYAQIGQRLRISMPMVQRRLMEASVRLCAVLKKSGATGQFEKLPPKGASNE